tara:strand:+ start:4004 stop:4276 length:273 start_codon:yes stop_codon:yes gene_type:complete
VDIARSLAPLAFAFFDRVQPLPHHGPSGVRSLARSFQRYGGVSTQAHLAPPPMCRDAQHPLCAAVIALVQPQARAVRMFASGGSFRAGCA